MGSLLNVLDYTSDATVSGAILVVIIMIVTIFMCIGIASLVLGIIGGWKVFEKAGEPGWKIFIPIYNVYIMCKITGVNPWWILVTYVASTVSFVFNTVFNIYPNAWVLAIFVILFGLFNFAVSVYFAIISNVSIARSFGKDTGWAIGLIFLAPYFLFALGIGKSKYVGPIPMEDPILGKKVGTKKGTKAAKFCGECGKAVEKNAKFCPNCGKKI